MGRCFSKCIQVISCKKLQSKNDAKKKINRTLLNCDANSNNTGSLNFVTLCEKSAIYNDNVLQKYSGFTGLQ